MIHQLRIYEINPSLKEQFDIRFKEHATRIMHKYEFDIKAMWYSEKENKSEFVYILEWPNKETLTEKWAAFMNDAEWEAIKQKSREEHGEMVLAKVTDQILESTNWFDNKI